MEKEVSDVICPLPWVHLSSDLDGAMRICCNTYYPGTIVDKNDRTISIYEIETLEEYFNKSSLVEIRKKMLRGVRPKICSKCYDQEDLGIISVRNKFNEIYNKNEKYRKQLLDTSEDGEIEVKVQSIDISLTNVCNLMCIMCSPRASTSLKKYFDMNKIEYDKNFYQKASNKSANDITIKLIENLGHDLGEYLTTGGEPFLNKAHLNAVKMLVKSGESKKIKLTYNTNLTIWSEDLAALWEEFKLVEIHISIDGYGKLNEYIRYGSKWNSILRNLEKLKGRKNLSIQIHCAVQILNIFNIDDLHRWISSINEIEIKNIYFNYVTEPGWLDIRALPWSYKKLAWARILKILENKDCRFHPNMRDLMLYLKEKNTLLEADETKRVVIKKKLLRYQEHNQLEDICEMVPELKYLF